MLQRLDTVVVGGGIVGLATAMALAREHHRSVTVLEAEERLAAHQSTRNSGVIHAGLYYRPGSLKARLCVEGREALYAFCAERGIAHERCGKVVVASHERELPRLDELEQRGRANGLTALARLTAGELAEREPHAAGVAALHVGDTGIVDYGQVARAMADEVREAGGEVLTGCRALGVETRPDELVLSTSARGPIRCAALVNCAGLEADRFARRCGTRPACRIVPIRGDFLRIEPQRRSLVRNLIYPVPDPRLPMLGVHLTRRIDGSVEVGPNAVLALDRYGYRTRRPRAADTLEMLGYPGFWLMLARNWRTGLVELWRSASRRAMVAAARRLVPALRAEDLAAGEPGIRAQAVGRDGRLLDDFEIARSGRVMHVLNAPSPAATASIAIGRWIAARSLRPA